MKLIFFLLPLVAAAPVHLSYDKCHKYCVVPDREHLFNIQGVRNVVCSAEGRRRLLKCAKCIDGANADESSEDSAMSAYRGLMEQCESDLLNE